MTLKRLGPRVSMRVRVRFFSQFGDLMVHGLDGGCDDNRS